jgi:hypothetical protein
MFDDLPRMAGLVSKLLSLDDLFKGCHFDAGIIVLCIRWYLQYKLSYRGLADMMAERGYRSRRVPFCAGSSTTIPSSRSAAIGSHARSAARGAWMRPT